MRVLVFDTETTGLPTEKNPSICDSEKWPYIVQLSYVVYNVDENELFSCYDEVLKLNDDIEISEESINLHKITKEINQRVGVNRRVALQTFNNEF